MTRPSAARSWRAACCVVLAAALAGCDSSPKPSASAPTFPPFTSHPGSAAPETGAPTETHAADVKLPPGAQFARPPTSIPGESEPVVTQFLTRAYFFATTDGHPEALYRDGSTWQRATIDDGDGYKPPSGASLDGPFRVVAAAAGDKAMVVLGASTTTDGDRPAGFDRLPESLIWLTRDGKAFDRIDPRRVVPDAASVRLLHVAKQGEGFVIVGNVLPKDGTAGDIVILSSPDGATWQLAARIEGEGTLYARNLFVDGTRMVIDATDQWCDSTGLTYADGLRTGITRAWTSADGGGTWQPVDVNAAGVLEQDAALIEGCPPNLQLADLIQLAQDLDTDGAIVGFARGALVARSRDGATVGVSTDFRTWSKAVLPGSASTGADAGRPYAQAIVQEFDGTTSILTLEDREDAPGRPRSGGCQVRWWRSADSGATWSTGPWGRPFATCAGATWSFEQLLDSSVVLFANAITDNTNRGEASFRTGSAGQVIPWETCSPGPDVDCSFATITNPTSEAPDWPGINLSGATITNAAIPGVQMPKMNGYAALLSGTFGAANLLEATLGYAILEGDFRGADFTDASLFNAVIRADLTGANLAGAELSGATFEAGAICPDGNAPAAGAADAKAACRL